jgi:hypothetical protein
VALGAPHPSVNRVNLDLNDRLSVPLGTLEWLVDWAGKGQDLS